MRCSFVFALKKSGGISTAIKEITVQTSGQSVPKSTDQPQGRNMGISFVLNGCSVSVTSNTAKGDEPLAAVKEILLSTYRTGTAKSKNI